MYTVLVTLIVLAALAMIGIVLIQESKGGGLFFQFRFLQSDWRCPQDHRLH